MLHTKLLLAGDTQAEIAKKRGFANHSGVSKRIKKIIVHETDKSSGKRIQDVEIIFHEKKMEPAAGRTTASCPRLIKESE